MKEGQPAASLEIADIMRSKGLHSIEHAVDQKPESKQKKYTMHTHSAVFVEVEVDEVEVVERLTAGVARSAQIIQDQREWVVEYALTPA